LRLTKEEKIKSFEELCKHIDWELLKKQKNTLLNTINKLEHHNSKVDDLEGILNLIDSIQDLAVDYYEIPEEKVFGKNLKR